MKKFLLLIATLLMGFQAYAAYQMVWSDEFNSDLLNTTAWSYEIGTGSQGWGNWEKQYYTNSTNNIYLSNGSLIIKALKDATAYDPAYQTAFTSARINSLGKVQAKYGKFEARIKLPVPAKGVWPAFWMMGTNGQVWPRCAEFDIMEYMCNSSNYNTINSTLHWYDESAGVDKGVNYGLATTVNNPTDWHVYTMEWTPTTIKTYIDGVEFYAADITPSHMTEFHNEAYILLNMAIGGTYVNNEYDPSITEKTMEVDYVRIYQDVETYPASTFTNNSTEPSDNPSDEPEDDNPCNKMPLMTPGTHYFAPGWYEAGGYVATAVNNNLSIQTPLPTYERWQAQFKYNLDQPLSIQPGVQYEFSFTITSDITTTNKVLVKLMQDDNNFLCSEEFTLEAGVPYQFTYTGTAGALNLSTLLFDFGGNAAFNITINDIYFGEVGCIRTSIVGNESVEFSISPNPTPGMLYISSPEAIKQVTIFNLLGKIIAEEQVDLSNALQLNLTNQVSGVYVVRLVTENGKVIIRRVIKQ